MSDKKNTGRFIVVRWRETDTKPKSEEKLKTFLKAKMKDENPKIRYSPDKSLALIEFKVDKDPEYLRRLLERPDFWKITTIYAVEETRLIKVGNMPIGTQSNDVFRFFTNTSNVSKLELGREVEVLEQYFRPHDGICVVKLKSAKDVEKVCAKSNDFKKYKQNKLTISPFYEDTDPLDGNVATLCVDPIIVENMDGTKLAFLKDFCADIIEGKFKQECGRILWSESGIKRVELEFDCPHDKNKLRHSETWKQGAKKLFDDEIDKVKIVRKPLTAAVWSTARDIIGKVSSSEKIWTMEEDERKHLIVLVGFKDDKELEDIEKQIDQIEKPKPEIREEIKVLDEDKVIAFDKLSLTDTIDGVKVEIKLNKPYGIVLRGDENTVKDAKTKVLELLNQIVFHENDLPSSDYAAILASLPIQNKIKATLEKKGWRCAYTITNKRLKIYALNASDMYQCAEQITNHVIQHRIEYLGEVEDKTILEKNLKKVEDEYSPYVKLSIEISGAQVIVHITCACGYSGLLDEELCEHIEAYLVKEDIVRITPDTVKYIVEKSFDTLQGQIEKCAFRKGVLKVHKHTLKVKGNAKERKEVIALVQTHASKIVSHWMSIEREGVHNYLMDHEKGVNFVSNIDDKRPCSLRIATQYEMRDAEVYCIVPLETGQALFVGYGSLTKPTYPVDAIVNAANCQLVHKGGLAKAIVDKGGKAIQTDCSDYIQKCGGKDLEIGDLYVGISGKLRCQKIIHAVGPEWKGGKQNEALMMQTVMENILKAMGSETNCILRSVAMPLISTGVFGFPKVKAAKILMRTIKTELKKYPNVREIYFYDTNQENVRLIQKQMQATFGDKCFHMPTTNVRIGQGTITEFRKSKFFKLKRTGSRTLPLPRNKSLIVQWGDIGMTRAEVVVCPTPSAPKLSGVIIQVLDSNAGAGVNLASECEKNFKADYNNGNILDGGITETHKVGRLLCSTIYCVKIVTDQKKIKESLTKCIKNCLERAVMQNVKEIAFPTIGTADCKYPPAEVARIFFRSVTDFMKLHPTCSLEKIWINIYHTDFGVTSAFEHVMEEMYCHRTHRLHADIKEESTDGGSTKSEEEEKKNEKRGTASNPQRRQSAPSPPRRQLTILKDPAKISAQGNMSYNIGTTSRYTVDVETANIEQSGADVIVCTSSSFPKLNGAIAAAIIKAGGTNIQDECTKRYQNYPSSGVAMVDTAGNLKCKKVFFVVLNNYKKNSNEKSIYDAILKCLEQAENEKCSSIAFPTFGTGGFKYPGDVSASKTFSAIKDFFKQSQRQYLTDVSIVLYGGDQTTCQAFHKAVSTDSDFTPMAVPTSSGGNGQKGVNPSPPQQNVSLGSMKWKVPNSSITLEITYGNLALSKADVILNTTTSYPNLNGAIPMELCKVAGPQLKQACADYKGAVKEGLVDETSGFNLKCQKVYHFVMPSWQQISGEQMIVNCIEDCLLKMKHSGYKSIAIPSIGTGGAKYNPMKVARGIYRAVQKFGADNSGVNCQVNLVLFQPATYVNKKFEDELRTFMGSSGNTPRPTSAKGVRFKTGDDKNERQDDNDSDNDDNIVIPRERRDFVLIQITTDDPQHATKAVKDITKMIDREMEERSIALKTDNSDDVSLMKGKNWKRVLEYGHSYKVKVFMDEKEKKILIRGFGSAVMDCYQQILTCIRDLRQAQNNEGIGHIVYQHIEWYYTEDSGKIWVPYPRSIMFLLEGAFLTKSKEKVFRDSDDKMYVADFNAMIEYEKDDKDQKGTKAKTSVKMIRKDFTEGGLKALPGNWEPMGNDILKEIKLNPGDAEYKQVEAAVKKTSGTVTIKTITEIRRIQNQSLYQQYQTMKAQLQATHKSLGKDVERTLWHGIKVDSEKSITLNGFNRSYSGQTFKDVWYGHGVYFAVNSAYSLQDAYSPADNAGIRRIYQVKVLTGKTTAVARGYADRFAPLISGSNIDRYDSTCNDVNNPEEFVIFKDTQAYPEYIIYFKT